MTGKVHRFWLITGLIVGLNLLFCQGEEWPEATVKWSDDPHVDSTLVYHFSVLRKVMEREWIEGYNPEELAISGLFFQELTGIDVSGMLTYVGLVYEGQELPDDYQKWWSWCQANKDRLVWDSINATVLLISDSLETDKSKP